MHTYTHAHMNDTGWRDLASELALAIVAFGVIALAARLFCWCFYISCHWRYSLGAILAVVMLKWLVPNLNRK